MKSKWLLVLDGAYSSHDIEDGKRDYSDLNAGSGNGEGGYFNGGGSGNGEGGYFNGDGSGAARDARSNGDGSGNSGWGRTGNGRGAGYGEVLTRGSR